MRTLILLFFLPLFGFFSGSKLDDENGFGIYKFGSAPAQYKNLEIELDEGKTQLYSATDNNINVSGVQTDHVRITFCKNRLSAIDIQTKQSTGGKFFQLLKERYGEPKKVKGGYEWLSKKVQLLYEPIDGKDAEITFYSREIYERPK